MNNIVNLPGFIEKNQILFVLVLIWTLFWKGKALWKAARNNDKYWFIAMLIINTLGILEILYLYVFSKKESKS